MALSEDQVRHVAVLARIGLTDEQISTLAGELSGILEHIEKIGELDLEGVEPMAHAVDVENVMRPDQNRAGMTQAEALMNAPAAEDGAFVIPRIVGVQDES
jgi:aspartyl-tRNA(Asn)/glutamyl-tRNA(Gln) amidotransferase subunit C